MKILIAAGGTGGHIFPAISLADKIKDINNNTEIIFCVDKRIDKKLLEKFQFRYYLLNTPAMPYKMSFRWLTFFVKLLFSFFASAKILKSACPDIVVGFGAYTSGPILALAKLQNKKILIHEQNRQTGRANMLLSKIADKIALSFPDIKYLNNPRYVLTGNPIRKELIADFNALRRAQAMNELKLDIDKKTVLLMGGSLGSRTINTAFLQMLNIMDNNMLENFQIIHLTGKNEFVNVRSVYKDMNVKAMVYPFFERMGLLYKAADFVISRSGAGTIAELRIFKKASILIPYPHAGSHQLSNAQFLKEKGAALVIEEKKLNPIILKRSVLSLLEDNEKIDIMNKALALLPSQDAAAKLADIILEL